MVTIIKTKLVEGDGYQIVEKLISDNLIDSINNKLDTLRPVRATSSTKKYAERGEIKNLQDMNVWWSQLVMDWPEVIEINEILLPKIKQHLQKAEWYASDIVTIEGHSKYINPHVDTPHRFKQFNYNKKLLGIQAIVALSDLDKSKGVTGLVPKSQLQDYNINFCYQGLYNSFFTQNCIQPNLSKGSVLFYNCRVLHSSMPNQTQTPRPALLCNYLDSDIIKEVKPLDNIWSSNDQSC